jgi:hypothetical protein
MSHASPEQLKFRRQFVLGPYPLEEFAHWRTSFVGAHLVLQVHEDLPLLQVEHDGLRLTLLGFVLDPLAPDHDDETILRERAERCPNAQQAPRCAAELSGRWVMIADDGTDLILFHDPCGLREVFHTAWDSSETWCSSQPHHIAQHLGLKFGEPQREFLTSPYFRGNDESWLPGPATAWSELRHLTPNHSLDLHTRSVRRYWPHSMLQHLELEEGAHLAAQLLRENIRAASNRFALALPLTAGMGSRAILAATRGIEDIWHYTGVWGDPGQTVLDAEVARQVLRRVRRKHHVIHCPQNMGEDFAAIYLQNTFAARASVGAIAEGLFREFPPERVQLSGHCSEIVRDTFKVTHEPNVTAERLAKLMNMSDAPYAVDQIDVWVDQVRPVAERTGMSVWDLFFMEQEYGVWAANGQSQWDLVHERMTPFNHRGLLTALMGVEPVYRQPPYFLAQRRMIEILWAKLLEEPFNQPDRSLRRRSLETYRKVRERGISGALSTGVRKLIAG